jgi:hypothetical protein
MGSFWMSLLAGCAEPDPELVVFLVNPDPVTVEDQVVDTFFVSAEERIDLLFVLDSSGPLADPTALVENASVWLEGAIGQHDLHLGVVTADLDDPAHKGRLIEARGARWIDSATPDPLAMFAEMVDVGVAGSPTVQSLGAAYTALALHADTFNAGFLRDDSAVHVVVVSNGDDETDPGLLTQSGFVDWLDALRPGQRSLSCLTVGDPVSIDCTATAWALGGIDRELADPLAAQSLGTLLHAGRDLEFNLTRFPIPETLQVRADIAQATFAFAPGTDWVYHHVTNSVSFLELVPGGTVVTIEYTTPP